MKKNMMRRLLSALFLCSLGFRALAQNGAAPPSPDFMTDGGKIRVVMVVCLTILIGLILYLVRLDRKISRLEKK
jgi:hypothetical protein